MPLLLQVRGFYPDGTWALVFCKLFWAPPHRLLCWHQALHSSLYTALFWKRGTGDWIMQLDYNWKLGNKGCASCLHSSFLCFCFLCVRSPSRLSSEQQSSFVPNMTVNGSGLSHTRARKVRWGSAWYLYVYALQNIHRFILPPSLTGTFQDSRISRIPSEKTAVRRVNVQPQSKYGRKGSVILLMRVSRGFTQTARRAAGSRGWCGWQRREEERWAARQEHNDQTTRSIQP